MNYLMILLSIFLIFIDKIEVTLVIIRPETLIMQNSDVCNEKDDYFWILCKILMRTKD